MLDLIQSILKIQKKLKKKYPMQGLNVCFIIRFENTNSGVKKYGK